MLKFLRNLLLYIIAIFTVLIILPFILLTSYDYMSRYLSWYNLSLQKIKDEALKYSNGQPVCLYIVNCNTDVATLKLIKDETELDIKNLKSIFWKRRFERYCEGYTENMIIDIPDSLIETGREEDARWSFYKDGFLTNHGHFQGSFASFYDFEKCTINKVLWK